MSGYGKHPSTTALGHQHLFDPARQRFSAGIAYVFMAGLLVQNLFRFIHHMIAGGAAFHCQPGAGRPFVIDLVQGGEGAMTFFLAPVGDDGKSSVFVPPP